MRLRLKTKITIFIALLVLGVVGVSSWLYLRQITRQVIQQAEETASLVTKQVLAQIRSAVTDAAQKGLKPASNSPEDLSEYIRTTLDESAALSSLIDSQVADTRVVYEVTIVDSGGTVLVSSDSALPGRRALERPAFAQFIASSFLEQLRVMYGSPQAYDEVYPFKIGPMPFGEIRVAIQTGLLASRQITPALRSAVLFAIVSVLVSALLAALVSNVTLAPLGRISAQLDHISRGEFDHRPLEGGDEFGQVSTKISQIGQQLRGVREIFSTLDQVLHGLEDGLLLFTHDGRAVMVSPAVEGFLGCPAAEIVGRRASEIFPLRHPLRQALSLSGEEFAPLASSEVEIPGLEPGAALRRVGVSVQVISEGGTHMGALVVLRDPESRERIGRQVQLADVTKGVAHEVKNPLNSMRLWLENLRESLPAGEGTPRQAVAVLDSEIRRLDSVVKRFLDFMRPAELCREETYLDQLVEEVIAITRPQMERAGVQQEIHCVSLPPLHVDRSLLKQALMNLVYNAIEAMPNGGRLTVAVDRRGDAVEISIADTGVGIKPEHRARVFQLFFTTRPGGSGIGLASAYKTVQLHEGSIDFESEPGRGTTFRIELPLTPRASEVELASSRAVSGVATNKA